MYNLVLQLEAALKTIDQQVFQARKELQWLSQDNRLAQKHQAAMQVLTSGWPNHMKPEARLFMVSWMFSETPKIVSLLRERGYINDHTAKDYGRYLNVLQQEPTTVPQGNDFYSPMTLLTLKSWETRSAFMEKFGGSGGCPLYSDETTPVPNKHIRATPASPQWQRKLELPLRIILSCINKHPDHTATSRMRILRKTMTIMQPSADDDWNPDVVAWARLFYYQDGNNFAGRLEVVPELAKILEAPPTEVTSNVRTLWEEQWNILVWGSQYEIDQMETEAFQTLKNHTATTGKGVAKGKPDKHWSGTVIWNSYFCPYPFDLQIKKVDAVSFCWDELCDKMRKESEKIGDYKVSTMGGKPPSPQTMPPPAVVPKQEANAAPPPKAKGAMGRGGGKGN